MKGKLDGDLTERDFQESPVWRYASHEEGREEEVEPCAVAKVSLERREAYLVAASAVLSNGETCHGFMRVARMLPFVEAGPLTLFWKGRQCEVEASIPGWNGSKTVSETEKSLLPIRWTLAVTLGSEQKPRAGSVSSSRLVCFVKSTVRGLRLQAAQ